MNKFLSAPVVLAALAMFAVPAWGQDAITLTTTQNDQFGTYLTDGDGRAVYLFTTDKPEGASEASITCTSEECLNAWPLVTSQGAPEAGEGADASMIGTMEYEGNQVVTYNGWPLYYFVRDEGQSTPQGQEIESFGGEWYLVTPEGSEVEGAQ